MEYFWLTLKKVGKKHVTVHQLLYKLDLIKKRVCDDFKHNVFEYVLELDKEPRLHAHVLMSSSLSLKHLAKIIYARGWHVHIVPVDDQAYLENIQKYMQKEQNYENEIKIYQNEARHHYLFI